MKKLNCITCHKEIWKGKRSDPTKVKCDDCKKKNYCNICGKIRPNHEDYDICKRNALIKTLIKYFGYDQSKLGSTEAVAEYYRIRDYVHNLYYDQEMSILELTSYFNYDGSPWNFTKKLQSLGIKTRSIKEASYNSFKNGRAYIPCSYKYNHGWHTTWDAKQVFYRSSYELSYAMLLDDEKIEYIMEPFQVSYFDSQQKRQRFAVPDFYLPEYNLIVEVKSSYTLDKTNMKDKSFQYQKLGYNFKLICDGSEGGD